MSLKRYRYIERDDVFQKMRNSVEVMSDDEINEYLDKFETWRDLTFIFDVRDGHVVNTIITDNDTNYSVALADLNGNAKNFYHEMVRKITSKDVLQYIRELLYNKRAV